MDKPPLSGLDVWRGRLERLRGGLRRVAPFASGVFAALLALWIYNLIIPSAPQLTARDVKDTIVEVLASATPQPSFSAQVYQTVQPSLVLIETRTEKENGEADESLGSGVIVDQQGDILTSLHVVAGVSEILVTYADGTQSKAQILFEQPENDIAVLFPEQLPSRLVPAVLGNPGAMKVGDEAFVVGNPFGLYSSMSAGVISGFNRSFQPEGSEQRIFGLIQVDAAVNPGNSGGPLLNRDGDVIGIVTGLVNPTDEGFFIGIGFAVPINIAVSGIGSPPY